MRLMKSPATTASPSRLITTSRHALGVGGWAERGQHRLAHFTLLPNNVHLLAEGCGHNMRGTIAWGNRGCISWPFYGPSEPLSGSGSSATEASPPYRGVAVAFGIEPPL